MTTSSQNVNVDDILVNFSLLGRYYVQFILLLFGIFFTSGMYWSNYIFVAEEVGYRCKDNSLGNDSCNAVNASSCKEWIYDNPHSFVAEFDLACQEWKRTLVGTMQCSGYMLGLLLIGPLSDKFGRKVIIITTSVLSGVIGLAKSCVTLYWVYCLLSFLESFIGDPYSPTFLFSLEMVAHKKRLLSQMLCILGSPVGGILLPFFAWLIPYWRNLLRVIYSPAIFFFAYAFLLDESPRWLLSKGKKEEAIAIIIKTAEKNKSKVDRNILDNLQNQQNKHKANLRELKKTLTSNIMLKRLIICLIWWLSSSFVSNGMTITSVSLPGNKYINFALVTLVEIPAIVMATFCLGKFRRKVPLIVCFMITAGLCLGQPFVPLGLSWLSVALYMVGKLLCSVCSSITFIYTCELFPTSTRNTMHAICSFLGNAGVALAPQTPLLTKYWPGLPSITFGVSALVAGLVTFLAPDTSDDPLPDTVKQAEAFGVKMEP